MKRIRKSFILLFLTLGFNHCQLSLAMKRGREEKKAEARGQQSPSKRGKQQQQPQEKRAAQAELAGQPEQKRLKTEKQTVNQTSKNGQEFFIPASLQNEEMATLQTTDGDEFTLPIKLAEQNETLKQLIEDAGTDSSLPLPNITSKTLATTISLNTALYGLKKNIFRQNLQQPTYIPRAFQPLANEIIQSKTVEELILLIEAANYLDNKFILNAMASAIADTIFKEVTPAYKVTKEAGVKLLNEPSTQAKRKLVIFFNNRNINPTIKPYILRHLVFRENGINQEYSIADYTNDNGMPKEVETKKKEFPYYLPNLIDISNKKITSLFGINAIQQNKVIKELDISHNCLYLLALDVQKGTLKSLSELTYLDLQNSQLAQLQPNSFAGLANLTYLKLMNNQLTKLALNSFSGLKSLSYLYLNNNQLTEIAPNSFAGLKDINFLHLNNNQLTEIAPNSFAGLEELGTLYLHDNQLTKLAPSSFGDLKTLYYLHLNNNKLTELAPKTFAGLKELQEVYLQNNQLKELPRDTFGSLIELKILDLSDNKLEKIEYPTLNGLLSMHEINLSNNQLTDLGPEPFYYLGNLNELNLSNNQLTALEDEVFSYLGSLYKLNLSNNQLTDIADEAFYKFGNLGRLDLSNNQLRQVNIRIFDRLGNLQDLNLSNNDLTQEEKVKIQQTLPRTDINF